MTKTILFDGVCNLCNGWVDFVVRRDARGRFRFAALQSESGRRILADRGRNADELTGLYLVDGERVHFKSSAVLRVLGGLGGGWPLMAVFLAVPPVIRNFVYDWIAKNRYKWFGKRDTCRLPAPHEKERFLP